MQLPHVRTFIQALTLYTTIDADTSQLPIATWLPLLPVHVTNLENNYAHLVQHSSHIHRQSTTSQSHQETSDLSTMCRYVLDECQSCYGNLVMVEQQVCVIRLE